MGVSVLVGVAVAVYVMVGAAVEETLCVIFDVADRVAVFWTAVVTSAMSEFPSIVTAGAQDAAIKQKPPSIKATCFIILRFFP